VHRPGKEHFPSAEEKNVFDSAVAVGSAVAENASVRSQKKEATSPDQDSRLGSQEDEKTAASTRVSIRSRAPSK